jgi:hypothetical protein
MRGRSSTPNCSHVPKNKYIGFNRASANPLRKSDKEPPTNAIRLLFPERKTNVLRGVLALKRPEYLIRTSENNEK